MSRYQGIPPSNQEAASSSHWVSPATIIPYSQRYVQHTAPTAVMVPRPDSNNLGDQPKAVKVENDSSIPNGLPGYYNEHPNWTPINPSPPSPSPVQCTADMLQLRVRDLGKLLKDKDLDLAKVRKEKDLDLAKVRKEKDLDLDELRRVKDLELAKMRRELINEASGLRAMRDSAVEWRKMWIEVQKESTGLKREVEEMKRELCKAKAERMQTGKVKGKTGSRVVKRVQKSRKAKTLALKALRAF